MIPVLPPSALVQEMAACVVLGACTGAARAVFPAKGRASFVPDVLWVGATVAAVQSYAAGQSSAGVLRWYMAVAAFAGAGAAAFVLSVPLRAAGRLLWCMACLPGRLLRVCALQPAAQSWKGHREAHKRRRDAKRTAKKRKKNLQNRQRLLYNSNISK